MTLPILTPEVVHRRLRELATPRIQQFSQKLIPTLPPETILGVTLPNIRALAREFATAYDTAHYLSILPHAHFEELALHGTLIGLSKDFHWVLAHVEALLPHITDWASCDTLSPKVFARHPEFLLPAIEGWLGQPHEYTVRFGITTLMRHYLTPAYAEYAMELATRVSREEYYIRMAQAWFVAEACAKAPQLALQCIQQRKLSPWVHAKAIQKARESRRVEPELKRHLLTLR